MTMTAMRIILNSCQQVFAMIVVTGSQHLHSIQSNEISLIQRQRVAPTPSKRSNPENAAYQNGGICKRQRNQEPLELGAVPQFVCLGFQPSTILRYPEEEEATHDAKHEHSEDLKRQTRDYDITGDRDIGPGCSQAGANCLQRDAEAVAADEDIGVKGGLQQRQMWTEDNHQMLQIEVESGCNKGWCNRQTDDLQLETSTGIWVLVK